MFFCYFLLLFRLPLLLLLASCFLLLVFIYIYICLYYVYMYAFTVCVYAICDCFYCLLRKRSSLLLYYHICLLYCLYDSTGLTQDTVALSEYILYSSTVMYCTVQYRTLAKNVNGIFESRPISL
jgi:hypothetical protein